MTEQEVLLAAQMAKGRLISFEITQKGELVGDGIVWPGQFSIWLQNPRTGLVHRLDTFLEAEAVAHHEDEMRKGLQEIAAISTERRDPLR